MEVLVFVPILRAHNYAKRKAFATLFSLAVVTGVIWCVLLAQKLATRGDDISSLVMLAVISVVCSLICPAAALRRKGKGGGGDVIRLAIIVGAISSVWLLVSEQLPGATNSSAAELGMLTMPGILYIGVRRAVAALTKRAFDRNILIIGNKRRVQTLYKVARKVGARHQIRTKVLDWHANESVSDEILSLVAHEGVNEVIIASGDGWGNEIAISTLLQIKMRGVKIHNFIKFMEDETGRLETDGLHPGWIVYSDGFKKSRSFHIIKRTIDIVASALSVVMCVPIMLPIAAAIKLCDSGPVIYQQRRVGYAGKSFVLYKLRSMSVDAEELGKPVWARQDDSRVTLVGRFIRATRIDELPQLINVLKGDMSLVGPRPERPELVSTLKEQIDFYDLRHYMLPGITGWAQINVGYTSDTIGAMRKTAYDLYYMKHASISLDLYILARTVKTILWGEGAR
jgi:exopolysaccharide biosynthesis polyprenyl glycosylphosphotransferase